MRLAAAVLSAVVFGCSAPPTPAKPPPATTIRITEGQAFQAVDPEAYEARALLEPICRPLCGEMLYARNDQLENATVEPLGDGWYLLVWSKTWLRSLRESFGREAILAVYAHEQGHVIDSELPSPWGLDQRELSADAWGGCALARGHYALDPVLAAYETFGDDDIHPAVALRQSALRLGASWCSR